MEIKRRSTEKNWYPQHDGSMKFFLENPKVFKISIYKSVLKRFFQSMINLPAGVVSHKLNFLVSPSSGSLNKFAGNWNENPPHRSTSKLNGSMFGTGGLSGPLHTSLILGCMESTLYSFCRS